MENYEPQANQPQPLYQQDNRELYPQVSFGDWLVTMLIMLVPVLNAIMLIVWSTDRNSNPSKANWAKASLVIIGIQIVLFMFFLGAFIGSITSLMNQFGAASTW
jgi:uncharacterized membrane protein YdbT with pleckstrin-like domain